MRHRLGVVVLRSLARHFDLRRQPGSRHELDPGVARIGRVHAVDVERVGVHVRGQRPKGGGPDAVFSLGHGPRRRAVEQFAGDGDFGRLRSEDANHDGAVRIHLRRDDLWALRPAAPAAAAACPAGAPPGAPACLGEDRRRTAHHSRECETRASHRGSLVERVNWTKMASVWLGSLHAGNRRAQLCKQNVQRLLYPAFDRAAHRLTRRRRAP